MPASYLEKGKGFGALLWNRSGASPYAVHFFGRIRSAKWRSPLSLHALRSDVLQYGSSKRIIVDDIFKSVIRDAGKEFRAPCRPLHMADILDHGLLQNTSTSPGLPWKFHGYKTKQQVLDDPIAKQQLRKFWFNVKEGSDVIIPDCCAFTRAHLAPYGTTKVRSIWGYSLTMIAGEASFAIPLIDAYKNYKTPIAYGYETATGGMRKLRTEIKGYYYLGLDYKSFDKYLPEDLIRYAFKILQRNIDFTMYDMWGVPNAQSLIRMWDFIVEAFINTTIRLPNGERYRKKGGVPSGSHFTQVVDSICNWILTTYLLRRAGTAIEYMKVFGDDSIVGISSKLNLNYLQELADEFGMVLNIEKSVLTQSTDELIFLGYYMSSGLPRKDFWDWVDSLYFPETPDGKWDDFATRALGLLYANGGVDEAFDRMCREVLGAREYELAVTRGFSRYLMIHGITLRKDPPGRLWLLMNLL